ncbi:FAD binding domain protein [Ilyonectria robusta]
MTAKKLKVIIVGAGFGGLAAAIECAERGMDVTVLEKYPDSNSQGDILDFFPNAGRVISRWNDGKVGQQIHDTGCSRIRAMELCKYDGKFIVNVPWARDDKEHHITYAGHRGKVHSIFLAHAKTLVEDIRIGVAVTDYQEEDQRAGVTLATGETLWGDCVIAADGPRSIARGKVLKLDDDKKEGKSSGWAVFRSFFKTDQAMRNHPGLQHLYRTDRDTVRFWMYDNLSLMAFVWNDCQDIAWVLIHPLVYRPTIDTWTSKGGRTILIGDAAHANLPTAGQGASQALEDAVTVAECLASSGGDVKLALEAAQRIRYHRSNAVHESGQKNRDAFYKIPWDDIEAAPEEWAQKRFPKLRPWDPLQWTKEHFPKVAEDIKNGITGCLDDVAVPPPAAGYW